MSTKSAIVSYEASVSANVPRRYWTTLAEVGEFIAAENGNAYAARERLRGVAMKLDAMIESEEERKRSA